MKIARKISDSAGVKRDQHSNQIIQLRARVFAGDDKSKMSTRRTPGIMNERRQNVGRQQGALEPGDACPARKLNGNDRAWCFGRIKSRGA